MAGSIKLFSFNRKFSHVIGIYPPRSIENDEPLINSRNWIFIITFLLFALSSGAFFVFEANSMLDYGLSFFATTLPAFLMCIYLIMIWEMENTWQFIENCERFIEMRESSIITFRKLSDKIEQLCKFVGIAFVVTVLFTTLPFLLLSLVNYYILELGEESFSLLFPVKCPFDWKTPLGFFVAWLAQSAGIYTFALLGTVFLILILGSCWLFIVMAEDITKDVTALNNDVRNNKNRAKWMKRFCDIVQLYSDVKQCVNDFNAIVKYSLFILIFLIMISVSSSLLTLQFQLLDENAKLFETIMVSIVVLWVFGYLLFICELGEHMTYHFTLFDDELERCGWYTLPIEMQRMYSIFLSNTQQPKHIACYGNILCARDSFKRITNTGFSYFVTIRQFET